MTDKNVHLTASIPLPLKRRVEQAAQKNGRSISAEVRDHLERSFDKRGQIFERRGIISDVLALQFGHELGSLLMEVAESMSRAGGTHWTSDPVALDQAILAGIRALEAIRPKFFTEGTDDG